MSEVIGARIRGISAPLPPGEQIRWVGSPQRQSLARHAFHARKICVYFALLLLWRGALAFGEPAPLQFFASGAAPLFILGLAAAGCSVALAAITERTTVYAITDRRVVMKIGFVLSSTINVPLRQIESASLKMYGDGSGDLALSLIGPDRLAYLMLWPHARAWRLSRPAPALRSLHDPQEAADVLRDVLHETMSPIPQARPTVSDGGMGRTTTPPTRMAKPASVA